MTQSEQRISVKSDPLPNLIADVGHGNYRIPQFQREFVWTRRKIIELLDSIYNEYPIGSFFLWKAGRKHNGLFRHSVTLPGIPPVDLHDNISFILDGQQRATSLYVTLNGLTVPYDDGRTVDYSSIAFDLKDEKFPYCLRNVEANFLQEYEVASDRLFAHARDGNQFLDREALGRKGQ